ncbi:hypothetical protein P23_0443 [Acinetobacter calcoaceticus]|nr:hypothetical protein P23_0443 [Acinetobacter calcoaceticus]
MFLVIQSEFVRVEQLWWVTPVLALLGELVRLRSHDLNHVYLTAGVLIVPA